VVGKTDEVEQLGDPGGPDAGGTPAQPERVGHVLGHRLVREQLPVLEHQREAAPVGRDAREILPVVADGPGSERLEARDGSQQGRLAAARRTEHGEHLAVGKIDRDVVDRDGPVEADGHPGDGQHVRSLPSSRPGAAPPVP
jgi:hypothetical protein